MPLTFGKIQIELDAGKSLKRLAATDRPGSALVDPLAMLSLLEPGGRSRDVALTFEDLQQQPDRFTISYSSAEAIRLTLTIEADEVYGGLCFQAELENKWDAPISPDRLCLLAVGPGGLELGGPGELSVFKNGWQSWSASESLRATDADFSSWLAFMRDSQENPTNRATGRPGDFTSEMVTCVSNRTTGRSIVLGFLTGADQFGDIRVTIGDGGAVAGFRASCRLDGVPLEPGRKRKSERLWLSFGDDAGDLLEKWAELTGRAMNARVPDKLPVGWCSWYYYYTGVTEDDVLTNLEAAKQIVDKVQVQIIQIDDGYQTQVGDWLSVNDKFPSGLSKLAGKIREAGFTPGIWTAPWSATGRSAVFREHPDWFIKNRRGKPLKAGFNPIWRGFYYALDPTHPEVEEYVRNVFRTLTELGFGFFKIDFIYGAALPGRCFDPSLTRAQVLRKGVELVRREIGDSFLLGCGAPLGPCIGLVDGMRIGPDVTPIWGSDLPRLLLRDKNTLSTVNAIRNTINRFFMHGRLWWNDPDCLMVRRTRSKLTDEEVRTLSSVISVSGGMIVLSDDISEYDQTRIELIGKVLELSGEGAFCPDLMDHSFPEIIAANKPWGYLVGLINYRKEAVQKGLDLNKWLTRIRPEAIQSITDVWSGRAVGWREGLIEPLTIPPHGIRLFKIKLKD